MCDQIYIVEGHPIVREGLTALITAEDDLAVCGEADSGAEARCQILELSPDLVLTDLTLSDGSGLTLIGDVLDQVDIPILVFSAASEGLYARRALEAGALGYLRKDEPCWKITDAIHHLLRGAPYLSKDMTSALLRAQVNEPSGSTDSPFSDLSDRELEIFRLMGEGLGRQEMANRLSLSPKTIDTYQEHLKAKLALDTNNQLRRDAAIWVGTNYLML